MVKREVPWSEKRKFALWATEGTLEKTKAWYKKDNCFSRSEFIEKAIDFYVGYLAYDRREQMAYIPNEEVRSEFTDAVKEHQCIIEKYEK